MNRNALIETIIKHAPKYQDGFILREALLRMGDLELASLAFDLGIDMKNKKAPLEVVK